MPVTKFSSPNHKGHLIAWEYPNNDRRGTPQLIKRDMPYDTYVYQPAVLHTEICYHIHGENSDNKQIFVVQWSNMEHTQNPVSNELVLSQYNDNNILVLSNYAQYAPESDEIKALLEHINIATGELWVYADLEQWRDKIYCIIPAIMDADPESFYYAVAIETKDGYSSNECDEWVTYPTLTALQARYTLTITDICPLEDFDGELSETLTA